MTFARMIGSQLRARINARKLGEIAPVPKLLMLESSSLCNLDCAKCPRKSSTKSQGNMDVGLALDLIKQANSMGIRTVSLSMLGEPLLNPELERIVEGAGKANMYVYMVSNGALLTPERSRSLIEAGVNNLCISIDGWDKRSYGQRHGNTNIELVLDNLSAFRRIRGRSANRPFLVGVITFDTESLNHLSEIRVLLDSYVDMYTLNPLTDFGVPHHRPDPALLPGVQSWKRMPCAYFWSSISVKWNGRVTACCNDYTSSLVYYNATEAPLEQIWQCATIKKFRRIHLSGKFHQMPLCGHCTRDWVNSLAFRRICHKFNSMPSSEKANG